jgi:hypothetical protein
MEMLQQLLPDVGGDVDLALAVRPDILVDQSVPEPNEMRLADGIVACLGFVLQPVVDAPVAFCFEKELDCF